jgi:LuxR family maltose regulon positive regulatory protein
VRARPDFHVARSRLLERLDGTAPLVLVSGPAGSGKTSLLDEWCTRTPDPARCRIALEDEDTLMWQPALRSLAEHGLPVDGLAEDLGCDALLGTEPLAALADAVVSSARRWTVVIDGYELTSPELADEVANLLARTEGSLRLVLATRVDPVLPLYRYRLDGSLDEVRAADLAFTDDEAGVLLARSGGTLPPEAVHDLNLRLGGWAVGLRFAGRALAGHPEPESMVSNLLGHDLDITDYLLHEVLDTCDPETRDLLLRTCVPDLLVPELLEDLVGSQDARRLAELARSNLFLEPGDHDGCLRYQPFFRDLLRARLAYETPDISADLHRRTAAWLRRREEWERSAEQLAAGGLWVELAQQLVDDLLVARILVGPDARLLASARRVPPEVHTPAAFVVRAALALAADDTAACKDQLDGARLAADDVAQEPSFVLVDAVRAAIADDLERAAVVVAGAVRTLAAARRPAARLASPEIEGLLQVATAEIALRRGELSRARVALARVEALPGLPAGFRAQVLGRRALSEALDARLNRAQLHARQALELVEEADDSGETRGPAAAAALALVALERDDLASVRRHLGEARVCRGLVDDQVVRAVTTGIQAHLEARSGLLVPCDVESLCPSDVRDPWLVGWLLLQAAQIAVAQGRFDDALRTLDVLADGQGPSGDVVAAAAYAEQGRSVAMDRALATARESSQDVVPEVHRLLVEAVHEADRHSVRAAAPLMEQALELAAREGARRPFREASPSVRRLLAGNPRVLARHSWLAGAATPSRPPRGGTGVPPASAGPARRDEHGAALVEPLTPKELEVLGHLEELLTTQEIAEKMFVSVNTVRTHVRSILRKLGVNRRHLAVRRARTLGLLGAPLSPADPITPQG